MSIFSPDLYFDSISDIDLHKMADIGIRAILLDIDNTMVTHNNPEPGEMAREFVKAAEDSGIRLCIVSNNSEERAKAFAEKLSLPYVYKARKPLSSGYRRAIKLMGTALRETATVGDQVFTDIMGGKLLGILTVMVKPISYEGETPFIRFKRLAERPFVRKYY